MIKTISKFLAPGSTPVGAIRYKKTNYLHGKKYFNEKRELTSKVEWLERECCFGLFHNWLLDNSSIVVVVLLVVLFVVTGCRLFAVLLLLLGLLLHHLLMLRRSYLVVVVHVLLFVDHHSLLVILVLILHHNLVLNVDRFFKLNKLFEAVAWLSHKDVNYFHEPAAVVVLKSTYSTTLLIKPSLMLYSNLFIKSKQFTILISHCTIVLESKLITLSR